MKGKKAPFPNSLSPMLATLAEKTPTAGNWFYEIKWDGYRALAFCNKKQVDLISRNNKLFNSKFYPLIEHLQNLKVHAVLDGEIVVVKENGTSSFGALQNWRSEADGDLIFYVFDILWLNGYSLIDLPLIQRKEILKSILPKDGAIRESTCFKAATANFLEAAKKLDLEGIVAKRSDSLYFPGERVRDWLKIKVQKRHEVVIGGYTLNKDSPKLFSSLLAGVYENGVLHYIGKIGTGFNKKMQEYLMAKFQKLKSKKCPFQIVPDVNKPSRFRPNPPQAKAVWLLPKLVCEVSYVEITEDGVMRHPSFEGIREDKEAQDVHMEAAEPMTEKELAIKLIPQKKSERKTLLNPSEESQVKEIRGHEIKFNHLSKVYWPEEGYTKRDFLNYYYQAAQFILPYLKNRPQSLNRFPNGIEGLSFYQKDVTATAPDWVEQFPYRTSEGEDKNYLIVQSEADLLWMANLGAIEMNPWNSTVQNPDNPTWCIIDIDPSDKNTFEQVIQTAQMTKEFLDSLKVESYCKTSGATGLHIYIPLAAKYSFDQCQLFGRIIATQVHEQLPHFTSIERYTSNRQGKVYVDFLQNRPKATLAAPYSVRPMPGAPVSMPLHWDEVKKGLKQKNFTIKNAIERMRSEGDLFKPVLGKGVNLKKLKLNF